MRKLIQQARLEKKLRKINYSILYVFILLIYFIAFKANSQVCDYGLLNLLTKNGISSQNDSIYEKTILIDNMLIELFFIDKNDISEIVIKVNNTGDSMMWVGVTSINMVLIDSVIIETILPDVNLEESINLVNLDKNYEIIISKNKFTKFNNFIFIFYTVNDLDKFLNCIDDKTKILNSYNEEGQIILEIPHDKMPDAGMTTIRLTNISSVSKLSELSYQVSKH